MVGLKLWVTLLTCVCMPVINHRYHWWMIFTFMICLFPQPRKRCWGRKRNTWKANLTEIIEKFKKIFRMAASRKLNTVCRNLYHCRAIRMVSRLLNVLERNMLETTELLLIQIWTGTTRLEILMFHIVRKWDHWWIWLLRGFWNF